MQDQVTVWNNMSLRMSCSNTQNQKYFSLKILSIHIVNTISMDIWEGHKIIPWNSAQHSSPWEAGNCSVCHQAAYLSPIPRVHCHVDKNAPPVATLSQTNPAHFLSYSSETFLLFTCDLYVECFLLVCCLKLGMHYKFLICTIHIKTISSSSIRSLSISHPALELKAKFYIITKQQAKL